MSVSMFVKHVRKHVRKHIREHVLKHVRKHVRKHMFVAGDLNGFDTKPSSSPCLRTYS